MCRARRLPSGSADSRSASYRAYDLRRQGSRYPISRNRAATSPRGRSQRPDNFARRHRLRRLKRLRRPLQHPERGEIGQPGAEVHPLPHDRSVRSHQAGPVDWAQSSLGLHGEHHRDRHVGTGTEFPPIEHEGPAGHDAEAEWLLDGTVRKVSRGSGVAVLADGAIRHVAIRRRRFRALLRLHRRREQSVVPRPL